MRSLVLITAPTADPVTYIEAKAHIRIDDDNEQDLIESLITAATQHVEQVLSRQLVTATWKLTLDCFPSGGAIDLPRPPGASVVSVVYTDAAGAAQTLSASSYQLDTSSTPARLALAPGSSWPTVGSGYLGAVQITYTAGYGAAATVPKAIKQAILFLVALWFELREPVVVGTIIAEIPFAVRALLAPYRVWGEI